MDDKQKHSDSFQLSNDIHNIFLCHNSSNRSLSVKCVVKVNIFILLNCINLLHTSFQFEFEFLLPVLTGYFIHEPLDVIFAVDIQNAIVFYGGDTWRPPLNDHIFWKIIVPLSMWLSTGLEIEGLAAPMGFSNNLTTSNFYFLTLLTIHLILPLSLPSKYDIAWTKLSMRSSMDNYTSLQNLVVSSAHETGILLQIGDRETTWMLSQLETPSML